MIAKALQNHILTMVLQHIDQVIIRSSPLPNISRDSQPSGPLQAARSFSRFEPPASDPSLHHSPDMLPLGSSSEAPAPAIVTSTTRTESGSVAGDLFVKPNSEDDPKDKDSHVAPSSPSAGLAESFESLPIELISLTDRLECTEG